MSWRVSLVSVAIALAACQPGGLVGAPGESGSTGQPGTTGPVGPIGPSGALGGYGFIPDPYFEEGLLHWELFPEGAGVLKNAALLDAPPPGGVNVLQNEPWQLAGLESRERVPFNPATTYEVFGSFRNTGSGAFGGIVLGARFYGADESLLGEAILTDVLEPTTTWSRFSARFGAGTEIVAPAKARYVSVATWLNFVSDPSNPEGHGPGNRTFEVTGLSMRRTEFAPVEWLTFDGCTFPGPLENGVFIGFIERTITLPRAQNVTMMAKLHTRTNPGPGRFTSLYLDGIHQDDSHANSIPPGQWHQHTHVWSGLLPAGDHTFAVRTYWDYQPTCSSGLARMVFTFHEP